MRWGKSCSGGTQPASRGYEVTALRGTDNRAEIKKRGMVQLSKKRLKTKQEPSRSLDFSSYQLREPGELSTNSKTNTKQLDQKK